MRVERIKTDKAKPFILKKHYAKRMPSVSYAFGLFTDDGMIGVCTFGTSSSSPLSKGICGNELSSSVIELNRLVINSNAPKNSASYLIANSMKMLRNKIIVSYADTSFSHVGYVYQSCNFIYTGLSAKRTDWKIKGLEHLHGQTIADMSRGKKDRAKFMRDKYGDDFYLKERSRKHRYIFFSGSKTFKKNARKALNYKIEPYPKGDVKKYECIDIPTKTTLLDFC